MTDNSMVSKRDLINSSKTGLFKVIGLEDSILSTPCYFWGGSSIIPNANYKRTTQEDG